MINIRHATLDDVLAVDSMYLELFGTMATLQPDYYLKAEQSLDFIESMIQSDGAALLLAEEEGESLGFIIVQQQKTHPYSCVVQHDFAYIIDLLVTEKARGKGIGSRLIEAAEIWAKERNLAYLELTVLSNNIGAKRLYERLAFDDAHVIMRRKITLS